MKLNQTNEQVFLNYLAHQLINKYVEYRFALVDAVVLVHGKYQATPSDVWIISYNKLNQ